MKEPSPFPHCDLHFPLLSPSSFGWLGSSRHGFQSSDVFCHVQEVRGHTLHKAPTGIGDCPRGDVPKVKDHDNKMSERLEVLRSNILNCNSGAFRLKAL